MADAPTYQLAVRVTPKSGKNEVRGVSSGEDGRSVSVRVTAPPEGGKANKAVCALIAKELGIAKGKVSVARGESSHHKMLAIDSPAEHVNAWLEQLPAL